MLEAVNRGRGGARPGAGRPRGSENRLTKDMRTQVQEAKGKYVLPLTVLLASLDYYWRKAQVVLEDGTEDLDPDKLKEAVVVAAQAAPYVHPKLAPIEAAAPVEPEEGANTFEEARRVAFLLRLGQRKMLEQK